MIDIKAELRKKGLNCNQLAQFVGVSRQSISHIATGKGRPSIDTAKKIAKILDIDWKDLF